MAQWISIRTRNRITTPIHCMYISDTIWVQCIHSVLVYLLHNLGTIHTIWVFLHWMLSQSVW